MTETTEKPYLDYIDFGQASLRNFFVFRISKGGDLFRCLEAKMKNEGIKAGLVMFMLGTLRNARLAYFNTNIGEFHVNEFNPPGGVECVAGSGTVSIQEDEMLAHIHVVVAGPTGNAYGGHIYPGSIVKEYIEGGIVILEDIHMERIYDEDVKAFPLKFFEPE